MAATKRKPKKAAVRKPVATAEDLLKALQEGVKKGSPEAETFEFFSDTIFVEAKERISTGVLALDRLTKGGWPIGTITEIASWEQVGKSTLLDQSIASNQLKEGTCALIDSEAARDSSYMLKLGVDLTKLIRIKAVTLEECFAAIEAVLDRQSALAETRMLKPLLIVWDSLGGTPAMAEVLGNPEDKHVMVAARPIKMNLRRLHNRLLAAKAALVVANHFYMDPGPPARRVVYGGSGMRYFAGYRIWLTRKGPVKVGLEIFGHQVEAMIKKDRFGQNMLPTTAGVLQGCGFHNGYTLFEWARENGVSEGHRFLEQRGAWYLFSREPDDPDPVKFQRGFLGFEILLKEQPDVYEMLATRYLQI